MTNTKLFDGIKAVDILSDEGWLIAGENADKDNLTQKYYKRVGLLYRCIDVRMASINNVPWEITKGETVVWSSEDEEAPKELAWLEDWPALLSLTEAALCMQSQAYLHKVRNRVKMLDLQWFAPVSMTPVWDEIMGLVRFDRRLAKSAKPIPFKTDEIVYIWQRDPMHETNRRVSPAEAACAAAGVIYNVDTFTTNFLERGAIKATLLTVEGNLAAQEKERLKSWWKRLVGGVKNAGNTEVISASVKPVIIGEGLQELSNTDLTGEKRSDLISTMGVPLSKILSDAANYATATQDDMGFYRDTIIPECKLIARSMNKQLFSEFGYRLQFTPDTMDIFQTDESERAASVQSYVTAGMKLSIAAEILGVELPKGIDYKDLDPEPQPIVVVAPDGSTTTQPPVEDSPAEQMQAKRADYLDKWRRKASKRTERGQAALCEFDSDGWLSPLEIAYIRSRLATADSREDVDAAFKAEPVDREGAADKGFFTLTGKATRNDDGDDRKRKQLELYHADKIERALRKWQRLVVPTGTTTENITPDLAVQRLKDNQKILRDAIIEMLMDGAHLGAETGIAQSEALMGVGKAVEIIGVNWELVNENVLQWALGTDSVFGDGYGDSLMQLLIDSSERQIRRELGEWINNNLAYNVLLDNLQRTVFSKQRADVLATTEITRAYAEGNRAAWRVSKVVTRMRWNTAHDEIVCKICIPLNGMIVDLNAEFNGYFPPAHVRCRCFLSPIVPPLGEP